MLTLDLHSFADTPIIGYGRVYQTLKEAIIRLCSNGTGVSLNPTYTGGDVQIYVGCPLNENRGSFNRKSDRFICLTMWESTKIPADVMANINEFDEIIVPSKWGKIVFTENGVTKPIHVIPLGIKCSDWPYRERVRKPDDKYTILWQGTYFGDRKGGQQVVDAFKTLDLPNARLILKLNPKVTKARASWNLPHSLTHDITQIGQVYDQDEMLDLLYSADLSVYPSYGEGFGLIPLEHMATGLPVILSDNTAMSNYCDNQFNIPLSCQPKAALYGELVGIDYIPTQNQLERAIKYSYENREHVAGIGKDASIWVNRTWDIMNTAKEVIELCLNRRSG